MQNPFTSGQIKNYIYFYASVLVIIILFFIASTLFYDIKTIEKKEFDNVKREKVMDLNASKKEIEKEKTTKFKLLEKAY